MITQDFIVKAQGYYGRYTGEQKSAVTAWLNQRNQKELPYIYAEVLKILSPIYKTPPGIYELEAALKAVKRERLNEVYPALPEPLGEKARPEVIEAVFEKMKDKIFIKAKK